MTAIYEMIVPGLLLLWEVLGVFQNPTYSGVCWLTTGMLVTILVFLSSIMNSA